MNVEGLTVNRSELPALTVASTGDRSGLLSLIVCRYACACV